MLPEKIVYIVVLINFIGHILYIKSIIAGHTKPNLVSWFLWGLAPLIGVFFQLKAGAGASVLLILVAGVGSLLITLAAILTKNGYWKITPFDLYCGLFSTISLLLYMVTKNLGLSILFAILSDALASVPTIIKSWKFPETEMWAPYLLPIFSNIIGLLAIKNWIFSIYSFGLYFIALNTLIMFCIYRKKVISIFSKTFAQ